MGLIFDFTKNIFTGYMCKAEGCRWEIYGDIQMVQHKGWCTECYHKELDRLYEEKWDD